MLRNIWSTNLANDSASSDAALTPQDALATRADVAAGWLFGSALPFWGSVGVDPGAGFVEHLALDATPADVDYKRVRVQARQIYVFSHAYSIGYSPGLEVAADGWEFVRDHAWMPDGHWARRLSRTGTIIDRTLDLYDQAFVLLAIAWWVRASGDHAALEYAYRTLTSIDERLGTPTLAGWLSEEGDAAQRLQNPHMHLLEALLALYATSGDDTFKQRAVQVLELFDSALFEPTSGTLGEYFGPGWARASGERGRIVEPGHHYEWVWLLDRAARIIPGVDARAAELESFALRFGHEPLTGLVYDELLNDGSVLKGTHRCWPNTEALKAHLVTRDRGDVRDISRICAATDNLFQYFLTVPVKGAWVDQLDAARRPSADKIPASTLYHLFVAFSELLRVARQVPPDGTRG
jgi:mannose/cellobiose epimerase-like protein (N-acyl-D-glucosamine 2-epimerase family)